MKTNDYQATEKLVFNLVGSNELEEAIKELKKIAGQKDKGLFDELVIQKSKLKDLRKHERVGDISRQEIILENNNIKFSILNISKELKKMHLLFEVEELESNIEIDIKGSQLTGRYFLFGAAILLIVSSFLFYTYFISKPESRKYKFPIKIAIFGPIDLFGHDNQLVKINS